MRCALRKMYQTHLKTAAYLQSHFEPQYHQVHESARLFQVDPSGKLYRCHIPRALATCQESRCTLFQSLSFAGWLSPPSPPAGSPSHRWHCIAEVWEKFSSCNLGAKSERALILLLGTIISYCEGSRPSRATFWIWKVYRAGIPGLCKTSYLAALENISVCFLN